MLDEFLRRYGWKTLAGTALLVLADAAPGIPALMPWVPIIKMAGTTLGGVGIVDKLAKMRNLQ